VLKGWLPWLSHGKVVDCEKVSSSYSQHPEEMKEFFSEAKKYAPNLVSLILHVSPPSTVVPSSSAPTPTDPLPVEVA
jgi:hypothetical protein